MLKNYILMKVLKESVAVTGPGAHDDGVGGFVVVSS
jgi:hypothetical protein